ncbi:MAG: hypothetical protein ABI396_03960 [Ktedonobacteraceae bacterium]
MRKLRLVAVVFVAVVAIVGFNLLASATAHAQTMGMDGCVHQPTIDTLEACVDHAADQGFINKRWVTWSLLAKLDRAENALRHERTASAINALNAFVSEVNAQSGTTIVPMHAMGLVMHAQLVISALENT